MTDKPKKPNIFEQRRRMIDEASGWADPPPSKPAPVKPMPKPKPKGLRRY